MTALRRWGMWGLRGTQAQWGQSRGLWAMAMVILAPAQDLDTTGFSAPKDPLTCSLADPPEGCTILPLVLRDSG